MRIIQKSADILLVKTELILATISGVCFVLMFVFAVYSFVLYADTSQGNDFFGLGATTIVLLLITLVFLIIQSSF
jgi:uncharacterized membrane-anchored protein